MTAKKLNEAKETLSPVEFDQLLGDVLQERMAERLLPLKKHLTAMKAAATKAANKAKDDKK